VENRQRVVQSSELCERFGFASKAEVFEQSRRFWNPAKTDHWLRMGLDLIPGRRQGYLLWDIDGHRLIDTHLCGGVFNLGHRHPEVVAAVAEAAEVYDIGSHHLPSIPRTALARELVATVGHPMAKVAFGSGGGEAVDIAIKSARYATKRRKIVALERAFHGTTGLALTVTDQRYAEPFLADRPGESVYVPFNNLAALNRALSGGDVAAVIVETIPATQGFPMPRANYYAGVRKLCDKYGTLLIADEVQTGLMRTGEMWAISTYGVVPDLIVVGKGLSGGIYPISAVIMTDEAAQWVTERPFGHVGTFGGAELGAVAGLKVLEILRRQEVQGAIRDLSDHLGDGLRAIQSATGDWITDVRQNGLVLALQLHRPGGGGLVNRCLYEEGILAMSVSFDSQVVQLKPGLLMNKALADELIDRLGTALVRARDLSR
jgi:acetylornithine/succinyldiaminopimelate/putrescine aminotransferase